LVPISSAAAAEKTVAEELLAIMWSNGQITDQQYEDLSTRAKAETVSPAPVSAGDSWFDRITLYGDLRGRYEGFWYNNDTQGNHLDNRHRLRARTRLGLKAKINDRVDAVVRVASDQTITSPSTDSRNQTLGEEVDFGPDGVFIDQAYIAVHPYDKDALPFGGKKLELMFGKMGNPFRSKVGKDLLIWDGDLTPEGVALKYAAAPSDRFGFAFNGGYFILDEDSDEADPALMGLQLRTKAQLSENFEMGANVSYYRFTKLDARTSRWAPT
jgi:hypothetical protein